MNLRKIEVKVIWYLFFLLNIVIFNEIMYGKYVELYSKIQ